MREYTLSIRPGKRYESKIGPLFDYFVLQYFREGETPSKIAARLGLNIKTVYKKLEYERKKNNVFR